MRIGCLQFAPQVGDVDNNLNRADAVLSRSNPEELDLLVLPELAFTGYNFESLQQIAPFLEPSGSGITSLWARTTALKYNCVVTVGYPEKVDVSGSWPTGPEYYNSAIVVNGDGETIANYRKSFLYYTDETWALEGKDGFYDGHIPGLGNTSIGICMDLKWVSPYKFEAPWHAFEFAFHILEHQSNLVIVSMAWLTREDARLFTRMPNEPDMETLTYWVTRLEPLIRAENDEEIIIVFCNRCGIEDDAVYAGTSAVVGVQGGEVRVYGILGRGEKELLVVDTDDAPRGKLVYRPDGEESAPEQGDQQGNEPPSNESSKQSPAPGPSSDQGGPQRQDIPPPPPPPPQAPPTSDSPKSASTSRQERPKPQIQIPKPKQSGTTTGADSPTSARSTGADSYNIPTPSAPSPTPASLRPKLIIPTSPSSQVEQALSPQPLSALSTYSTHSVQSERSVRSNQSVRSNERPPAESTPYPDTGQPLSGYPRPAPEKRIYGGDVSITRLGHEHLFSPLTPFHDVDSPMSTQQFVWPPVDSKPRTPMGSTGTPRNMTPRTRTPVSRTPMTAMVQDPVKRPESSNSVRSASTARMDSRKGGIYNSPPRHSDAADTQSTASSGSVRSRSRMSNTKPAPGKESTETDGMPHRPSSPKSRNASRSRVRERSDSALTNHVTSAVSQRLESISRRAESAERSRSVASDRHSKFPGRPSSPKSRNCSRSRPSEVVSSILISASPSLFNQDSQTPSHGSPHIGTQPRNSPPNASDASQKPQTSVGEDGEPLNDTGRSGTPVSSPEAKRRNSHTSACGRQQGHEGTCMTAAVERSRPRGTPKPSGHTHSNMRRDSATSGHSGSGPGSANEAEFEAIESVVCPNCPVHGSHSRSEDSGTNRVQSATTESHERPESSASTTHNDTTAPTESTRNAGHETAGSETEASSLGSETSTNASTVSRNDSPESVSAASVSVASTDDSPSTPTDSKTPTATVVVRNTAEGSDDGNLADSALAAKSSMSKCGDTDLVGTVEGATTATMA